MFKHKIPIFVTPLCLTLSSVNACSKKTPEDAVEAFCMSNFSCLSEAEQAEYSEKECVDELKEEIEYYTNEYGKDCEKAYIDYYLCLSELSCAEKENTASPCPDENNALYDACY